MKKPESYSFVLSVGENNLIPSINSLYKAKIAYVRGKPVAQIYKDTSAKGIITKLSDQLSLIDFKTEAPWIFEKDAIFDLQAQAVFKQSYFRRDADNLLKLLQDTIFRHFGLNDSRVITVQMSKVYCPDISEEKIFFCLSQSTTDIRFDHLEELPKPTKIYLQGSRGGLEDLEFSEDPSECDCYMYLLEPPRISAGTVAKIIDIAHTVKGMSYGSLLVGILPGPWESPSEVTEVIEVLHEISGGSKKIIAEKLSGASDILSYIQLPKKKRKKK